MGAGQVRPATIHDIPRILDLIEALTIAVSGPQRPCRIATGETLSNLINGPDGLCLVSNGGFIAGTLGRTLISPDPVAIEMGWYATDRSGLRLLRAFEAWAHSRGATLIKMSCNGGAAQALLVRCGYRVAETAMVK